MNTKLMDWVIAVAILTGGLLVGLARHADAQQPTDAQRIARLEGKVAKLEAALVEMRGNIKEYHFSTAAGDFVCMRCQIKEDQK